MSHYKRIKERNRKIKRNFYKDYHQIGKVIAIIDTYNCIQTQIPIDDNLSIQQAIEWLGIRGKETYYGEVSIIGDKGKAITSIGDKKWILVDWAKRGWYISPNKNDFDAMSNWYEKEK